MTVGYKVIRETFTSQDAIVLSAQKQSRTVADEWHTADVQGCYSAAYSVTFATSGAARVSVMQSAKAMVNANFSERVFVNERLLREQLAFDAANFDLKFNLESAFTTPA